MFEKLTQALELSKKIFEAANSNAWQEVEQLQQQRDQLIRQAEQDPMPEDSASAEAVAQTISMIQKLDQQTVALVGKNKQSLIDEKRQQNKGQQMKKAYQTGT